MSRLMIPGAFEIRARVPLPQPRHGTNAGIPHPLQDVDGSDRLRLDRELEGGGAPSQRRGQRRGTLMSRLWQTMLHPTHVRDIWRRVRAQALLPATQ